MSDNRPPILIPGNLKGSVPRHIVAKTDYIYDDPWDKTQREINEDFDQRITDIQELAEISIEGGDIQIATSADFVEPISPESRAKIPTVGAIVDGYILAETGNVNRPVFINRNHKPEEVTGIDVPENIHSNKNIQANWGVAAYGIADLSIARGGGGTLTEIQIDGITIPDVNGVVNLPAYPSELSQLSSDSTHRLVTDTQIFFWTEKYDFPTGGIPKTDLSNSVQNTLDTADSTATRLSTLLTSLINKGAHNLPVYFDSNAEAQVIDSLLVSGNIQSTQGGVSAFGIGSLALGAGGGQGTLTEIQIDGITIPDVEGIVNLPAYPTWATLSGRPTLSAVATSGRFIDLTDTPSTLAGYGILDAKIDNGVITLGSNSITPITSHQTIYTLTIQKNGVTVDSFNAASANKTINIEDVASLSAFNTLVGHLTSKGSHSRPIYLNGTPEGVEIDSLNVPGNIESTQGGVSAFGISSLAVSGGSGTGTLTQIQINGTPVTDTDGIVNITATTGSSAGKIAIAGQQIAVNGLGSAAYASTSDFASASHTQPFSTLTNLPTTLSGYGITDAASSSDLSSLSGRVNTIEGYFNGGIANSAARLSNNAKIGDTNNPVYFTANGVPAAISYTIGRNVAANEDVTAYQGGDSINITNHVVKVQMAGTSSPSASGNDISFIDTVSQSTAGVLTATKKTVRSATQSQSGVVTTGEQTFAGAKTFNSTLTAVDDITSTTGDIMALAGGVSAFGIASLSSSGGGGSGTLTQIQVNDIALGDTEGIVNITATSGSSNGQIKIAGQDINVTGLGQAAYCGVGQVYSGNSGLVTGGQVYSAISALPTPMQFKGSLGVGGTYTASTLPAAAASNNGWDLKVITDGTYQGVVAKVGDQLISDGTNWILIPSGDEPSGTVTSVGMTVPTGLSVSGSPITSSGILAISFASGYSIPTTSKQSNWDTAYTHASDSSRLTTAKASAFYKFGTTAQGHISSVTAVSWSDITGLDNGTTYAPYNSAGYLPLSGGTMANTNVVTNLNADLLDGKHASSFVLYDPGAAEQTIKSSISSLSKGVINLWRNSGDHYTFLGFSNGTTETYLGGIGFKSQSDHNLYRKNGSNYYKIWDENNDGSGSGLDADKLDGVELTGLFTTLENSNNQVSITIGTTNKKLTVAYASVAGKVGTSTVGSASLPVYINSGTPTVIGSLSVPGNIQSTGGGVSAMGIADLSTSGGGGSGTLTQIQINGTTLAETDGIVNIIADGTYNISSNKLATQSSITSALNTLDYTAIGASASKTLLSLTETNGVINATFQDISIAISQVSGLQSALDNKLSTSLKGAANGLAELDANGLVPSSQLPSYVDDVLEYASKSAFPSTGTSGKIYVALDTNLTYRWSGSAYVEISPSLALGETSSTAYRGDRGKTAYDHATETKSGAENSGFYKFSVTAQGHISGVSAVTASDLTSLIGSTTYAPYNANGYLPLSGGTMANTNLVTNLNADLLDGKHSSDFVSALGTSGDYLTWTKTGGSANNIIVPYASLATDTRVENLTNQTITYRQTAGGGLTYKPSAAVLKRVLGNSAVWNQAVNSQGSPSGGAGAGSAVKNADGSFTYTKTTTGTTNPYFWIGVGTPVVIGHTYFLYFKTKGAIPNGFKMYEGYTGQYIAIDKSKILTATANNHNGLVDLRQCENGAVVTIFYEIIDLTLFFNGNIPTGLTAETFERDYGYLLANPEYNAGTIINNAAEGLESTGFNLWDEEWENGYIGTDGAYNTRDRGIRSKNFTPCVSGSTYHIHGIANSYHGFCWYDINKNFLGTDESANAEFNATAPAGAAYFKLSTYNYASSGTAVYNHDICINLSDSSRNGTYEPYKKNVLPLNLNSFRVKDAQGNIVTINGLKKAGSVYDEIVGKKFIQRVGSVDLGTLSYYKDNNVFYSQITDAKGYGTDFSTTINLEHRSDANINMSDKRMGFGNTNKYIYIKDDANYASMSVATFKTAMNGVMLYYELATPIEYEIIEEAPYEYPIDVLGTERIVSDELVAPFVADIQYGAEQRDIAVDINNLHISAGLLSNRASALESYFTDGIANNAARLSNTSAIGSTTKPVYFTANGVPSVCSDYAGGTAVTLNGASKAASTASFYAPTGAGTSGQILKSTAGTPEWINQSALVAGKATQLENSRTIWGQSFNGTSDIGTDKYAKMPYLLFRTVTSGSDATIGYVGRDASNNVIHLTSYSGVPVSLGSNQQDDLYITTDHKIGVGLTNPSDKFHVDGNVIANGGVAARGMATLQGGTGTGNPVTQINVGSTSYTPTDGIVSLPTYPTWSTLSGKPSNVSAFTNDSGYIDSSALAVTFTTTTLTSSSTSVYLNNTVQRDTLQKVTISSASYSGQTFSIKLTGSGSYYGYHRQVLVMNNSGKNISLSLTNANYIYMGTYEWLTSGGWQHSTDNPIPFDNDMNSMFLLDIIQASSSEYPVVKVTRMHTYVD